MQMVEETVQCFFELLPYVPQASISN